MAFTKRAQTDWIALLEKANAAPIGDTIPPGFKPMEHWLKEFGIGETTWRRKIPILEQQGIMVRQDFRVLSRDNKAVKKPFWKKKG